MAHTTPNLVHFIAQMCYYAQSHIEDFDISKSDREFIMEPTSYAVACFIAQNTVDGIEGCERDIVLKKLASKTQLSLDQWVRTINKLIKQYGGIK